MLRTTAYAVLVALLPAAMLAAQDAECHGQNLAAPPMDGWNAIDLARIGGTWKAVHGRVGPTGSNRVTSLSVHGDSIVAQFDELKAAYSGVFDPTGVVRGSWTQNGKSMRLNAHCWEVAPRPDASPHKARMITVDKGVQLEVLDWGGSGRPLVFLHGLGATAHEFDAFAQKLTGEYHVYGITRRGAGYSSHPDSGYTSDRLGDDIVAVLDSLRLVQPVLVGHSFGGEQVSNVGTRYPKRVAGLVYLDAATAPAYVDSTRDTLDVSPDTSIHCPCSVHELLDRNEHHVHHIPLPVLAIYAMEADWDTRSFDSRQPDWTPAMQAKEFERGVPTARVVRVPDATHLIFRSNEATVLAEMRAFITKLPPAK